jgi:hypothetical protein
VIGAEHIDHFQDGRGDREERDCDVQHVRSIDLREHQRKLRGYGMTVALDPRGLCTPHRMNYRLACLRFAIHPANHPVTNP